MTNKKSVSLYYSSAKYSIAWACGSAEARPSIFWRGIFLGLAAAEQHNKKFSHRKGAKIAKKDKSKRISLRSLRTSRFGWIG